MVFVGSSSIRFWDLYASFPGRKYLNRGEAGDVAGVVEGAVADPVEAVLGVLHAQRAAPRAGPPGPTS